MSVDKLLWDVFTEYNLRGNPLEPTRMSLGNFRTFCKDCRIFERISKAEIEVMFSQELSKQEKKGKTLLYSRFLELLARVAKKLFQKLQNEIEVALQEFIASYILPNAKKRRSLLANLEDALKDNEVGKLRVEFEPSIRDLMRKYDTMIRNQAAVQISYSEFLRFAHNYDLIQSGLITTYQLGEIYFFVLQIIPTDDDVIPSLDFQKFWSALYLCSIESFSYSSADMPQHYLMSL